MTPNPNLGSDPNSNQGQESEYWSKLGLESGSRVGCQVEVRSRDSNLRSGLKVGSRVEFGGLASIEN